MCISKEDYRDRIVSHKLSVYVGIQRFIDMLMKRALYHDDDKLWDDIFESFRLATEKFSNAKFGSPEYQQAMDSMKPALEKHYSRNRHHPQHFENGISGMSLVDLVEMIVDWKSASSAYGDSFESSLEINKERFSIDEQLFSVIKNTAIQLGYMEKEEGKHE